MITAFFGVEINEKEAGMLPSHQPFSNQTS